MAKFLEIKVDIAMTLPQGVGYAAYDIVSTGDSYQLIQTDDTSSVYDMECRSDIIKCSDEPGET